MANKDPASLVFVRSEELDQLPQFAVKSAFYTFDAPQSTSYESNSGFKLSYFHSPYFSNQPVI